LGLARTSPTRHNDASGDQRHRLPGGRELGGHRESRHVHREHRDEREVPSHRSPVAAHRRRPQRAYLLGCHGRTERAGHPNAVRVLAHRDVSDSRRHVVVVADRRGQVATEAGVTSARRQWPRVDHLARVGLNLPAEDSQEPAHRGASPSGSQPTRLAATGRAVLDLRPEAQELRRVRDFRPPRGPRPRPPPRRPPEHRRAHRPAPPRRPRRDAAPAATTPHRLHGSVRGPHAGRPTAHRRRRTMTVRGRS
jgi:hypothetical protein